MSHRGAQVTRKHTTRETPETPPSPRIDLDALEPAEPEAEVLSVGLETSRPAALGDGTAAAASPQLTEAQRVICERVINVFETGSAAGRYAAISIYPDGPHDIRQITYGRSQTTEYGNLRELVAMYVEAGGAFADELKDYVPLIGRSALVDNAEFKALLKRAGDEDSVMHRVQDAFFDRRYFQPALRWAGANDFIHALSILVIYDSFIHSGSILELLRSRFPEKSPSGGGDEMAWISQYIEVRHAWLSGHRRQAVRASAYRTRDLRREVERGNWDLDKLPIMANGVAVDDRSFDAVARKFDNLAFDEIPYLGSPDPIDKFEVGDWEVWSELEPPGAIAVAALAGRPAAASSSSFLAGELLCRPNVDLATVHVSGVRDAATARRNVEDAARGLEAHRSAYGTAPGGSVPLDQQMLTGLVALSDEFGFAVSEIAGGEHNRGSRHYAGVAADFNVIDGRSVRAGHPSVSRFMARCRSLGASEVLGPGDRGHSTHVHAAWPRPA